MTTRIKGQYAALGGWPGPDKLPLVYNPIYNIGFMGLEKLHPFDSKKYSKVSASGSWGTVVMTVQPSLSVATAEGNARQNSGKCIS